MWTGTEVMQGIQGTVQFEEDIRLAGIPLPQDVSRFSSCDHGSYEFFFCILVSAERKVWHYVLCVGPEH